MYEWISGCDLSTFTREKGAKIQVINELIHIIHFFLMWIGRETQKLSTQKICKKTINFTPNRKFFGNKVTCASKIYLLYYDSL